MTGMRQQRGAFMVMMALLAAVIIGIAALALDVGRIIALRAEMQNAVDAAALAAAVELDGKDGARSRAMSAARHAVSHDSRYARLAQLLGDAQLPDGAFNFFCIIGSRNDVDPDEVDMTAFCEGSDLGDGKWQSEADKDAHYVRVRLDPQLVADHFTVDLIFLPVLRAIGIDTLDFVSLEAEAVAGRHFYECNYPPMVICDPFEGTGTTFREAMRPGEGIMLRDQGGNSSWAAGNFGFLEPRDGGSGATDVALYLADEGLQGCAPPRITTKPGENMLKTTSAVNTRFDIYGPPAPFNKPSAAANWPPAPNVMPYPHDNTNRVIAGVGNTRFGNGDWDFDAYWATNHPTQAKPNAWSNLNRPTRWAVYLWEIDNNAIPPSGRPTPSHIYTGDYPPPRSIPERRILHVAVASCEALGIKGKSDAVLFDPDGFAKMFLYQPAKPPSNAAIYAEYLGWSQEEDAHYHVDIQLYE